jgi:DNA/RNA endonuclease G (NUC1)
MNARSYRVNLSVSLLDFPPIMGLGQSSVSYHSEPHLNKKNVVLTITKKYVLTDMNTNKEHEVLSVQSDYEIPTKLIKSIEDVYEFYKDATLSLNEAYQYARTQLPALPNIPFPNQPIENYKGEIDRVFSLLNSQN